MWCEVTTRCACVLRDRFADPLVALGDVSMHLHKDQARALVLYAAAAATHHHAEYAINVWLLSQVQRGSGCWLAGLLSHTLGSLLHTGTGLSRCS